MTTAHLTTAELADALQSLATAAATGGDAAIAEVVRQAATRLAEVEAERFGLAQWVSDLAGEKAQAERRLAAVEALCDEHDGPYPNPTVVLIRSIRAAARGEGDRGE